MDILKFKSELDKISIQDLNKLKVIISSYKNIIILGNGGSNAISSHISQDYTKVLSKRCLSFSDSSRLTCYINDYGMDYAYMMFIEHLYDHHLVILISSSGNSQNIINCARYCQNKKYPYIILSGFSKNNKLNSFSNSSELSFWIDSDDYGIVELLHEFILHSII